MLTGAVGRSFQRTAVIAVNMQIAPQTKHTVTASKAIAAINSSCLGNGGAGHCLDWAAGWGVPRGSSLWKLVYSVSVKGVIWLLLAETPCWEAAPVSSASMTQTVICECLYLCRGTGLAASQRKLSTASETAQLQQSTPDRVWHLKANLGFSTARNEEGRSQQMLRFCKPCPQLVRPTLLSQRKRSHYASTKLINLARNHKGVPQLYPGVLCW